MHRSGKTLNADVKLNVLMGADHSVYTEYERRLTAKLPEKTPFKTLNVLTPKDIDLNTELLIEPVELLSQKLVHIACKPLQGRLQAQRDQLTFPFGLDAGLKVGSLAYVTNAAKAGAY